MLMSLALIEKSTPGTVNFLFSLVFSIPEGFFTAFLPRTSSLEWAVLPLASPRPE